MRIILPLVFVFVGATGAASADPMAAPESLPFPPGITVEDQCGPLDDLQDVELYDGSLGVPQAFVADNEQSTVQIQWLDEASIRDALPQHAAGNVAGARWCTGTLFNERFVLTAGHCFDRQDGSNGWTGPFTIGADGRAVWAPPEVTATVMKVNFRYQVDKDTNAIRQPEVSFPIKALREHRKGPDQLDYAIIEVGTDANGQLPQYPSASIAVRPAVVGEMLGIIQHPQGNPKKIEAGPVSSLSGPWILYDDLDTWGGSSGSGIRGSGGEVVGVHTNGGCAVDGNRGVSTVAISAVSDLF